MDKNQAAIIGIKGAVLEAAFLLDCLLPAYYWNEIRAWEIHEMKATVHVSPCMI